MRHVQRRRVAILMYHGFTEETAHDRENRDGNHLHVDMFARQVGYLAQRHNIVSLHEFIDAIQSGISLPDHTVVLTMDDGYRSNYELALPILERHRAKATIFLTTGFVESGMPLWPDRVEWIVARAEPGEYGVTLNGELTRLKFRDERERARTFDELIRAFKAMPQAYRDDAIRVLADELLPGSATFEDSPDIYRPLEWDDVRAMVQSGLISIGNHTHTHVILSRVDVDRQQDEIQTAHEAIEAKTGIGCDLFCYPNGLDGDFGPEAQQLLRRQGYRCALTAIPGFNGPESSLFELRRFPVLDSATFDEFLLSLYGGIWNLFSKSSPRSPRHAKVQS